MRIWAIAHNTFREAVRDRVLLTLVVVAFLVTAAAGLIPSLAAGEEVRIIKDLGLKSMSLFCVLIAVLVGGRLVYREIERRTILVVLAKPIWRWEFLVGKYFGLMLVLLVSVAIMSAWFALFMVLSRVPIDPRLLLPVAMLVLRLGIITAIAVLFSTFVTPISGAVFTLGVYFLGNLSRSLLYWGTEDRPAAVRWISSAIYYAVPNFSSLDFSGSVIHNQVVNPAQVWLGAAYALVYTAAVLLLAILVFGRRNFNS